jgi:hypothetical protein
MEPELAGVFPPLHSKNINFEQQTEAEENILEQLSQIGDESDGVNIWNSENYSNATVVHEEIDKVRRFYHELIN